MKRMRISLADLKDFQRLRYVRRCCVGLLAFSGIMLVCWMTLKLEVVTRDRFAIFPGHYETMVNIVNANFLHGDHDHYFRNMGLLSLLLIVSVIVYGYTTTFFTFVAGCVSSSLANFFISNAQVVHIGMSGVDYAFLGLLFSSWHMKPRTAGLIISSVAIILFVGFFINEPRDFWPNDVTKRNVSWMGHSAGLLTGILAGCVVVIGHIRKGSRDQTAIGPSSHRQVAA